MKATTSVNGAGLGLRREMMTPDLTSIPATAEFFEVAPENWIGVSGRYGDQLLAIGERIPLAAHGLSLSIGGIAPISKDYVSSIKQFLHEHKIGLYSEHLSYTDDGGQLYDLLPLPFTEEAVKHVAARVRQVQDILERKIALENVSYYLTPDPISQYSMSETDFIKAVLSESDCELLLDINNVYVNSINHDYDAIHFIDNMPAEKISYYHVAGHYVEEDGLIIDTHGSDVIDPVWQLLAYTYRTKGIRPTLLERDFNIPDASSLANELDIIVQLQHQSRQQEQRHDQQYVA